MTEVKIPESRYVDLVNKEAHSQTFAKEVMEGIALYLLKQDATLDKVQLCDKINDIIGKGLCSAGSLGDRVGFYFNGEWIYFYVSVIKAKL